MAQRAFTTKHGRPTTKYKAKFSGRTIYGGFFDCIREFWAVNEFQAKKIATGIANKNSWTLVGVGNGN